MPRLTHSPLWASEDEKDACHQGVHRQQGPRGADNSARGINALPLHAPPAPTAYLGKNLPASAEDTGTWARSPRQEDSQEEGMATHSSVLAWRIPWAEEPGGYSPWGHKESTLTGIKRPHAHYTAPSPHGHFLSPECCMRLYKNLVFRSPLSPCPERGSGQRSGMRLSVLQRSWQKRPLPSSIFSGEKFYKPSFLHLSILRKAL